jgi:uncharacterized membrane protein (UPF0182 family)
MTTRGRRVLVALASVAGLLFLGRWSVEFLAQRWWAGVVSPAGDLFALRWSLLKIGLEIATVGIGITWFGLTLWHAARHGARVGAGLGEETDGHGVLAPAALRAWALGIAVLLGVLTGTGSASWASAVALARQAPRFGLLDPHLGWDAGFFLAILPVLQLVHQFVLALVLLGFVATAMLYAVAGALRVTAREFTLDPAIRLHLGTLGTLLALVFGAGYLLEPLELIAGMRPSMGPAHAVLLMSLARLMAGFSLAVALLTIAWAVRGRVMLPVGGWASFALFAIAVRLLAPTAGTMGAGTSTESTLRELEQEAFAIPAIMDSEAAALLSPRPSDLVPSLWDETLVASGLPGALDT